MESEDWQKIKWVFRSRVLLWTHMEDENRGGLGMRLISMVVSPTIYSCQHYSLPKLFISLQALLHFSCYPHIVSDHPLSVANEYLCIKINRSH